jgi:hypothetical protein
MYFPTKKLKSQKNKIMNENALVCDLNNFCQGIKYKCLCFFVRLVTLFKFYVGIPYFQMCQTKCRIKQSCHYHLLFLCVQNRSQLDKVRIVIVICNQSNFTT